MKNGRDWRNVLRSPELKALPADSAFRSYVRIMAAREGGKGVRFNADEVDAMADDDAIATAATNAVWGDGR